MTDDERTFLRQHFDEKIEDLKETAKSFDARLKQIESHLAGVVTWRSLAFAITTAATIVTAIFLVAGGK